MNEDKEFEKFNKPYPCKFCGMGAGYAPLDELRRHGMDDYFCHSCLAEYLFFSDGHLASTSLYTIINGKTFRWSLNGKGKEAYLWYVKTPGIPGTRKNEGLELIKSFDYRRGETVPNITPQNINDKIRTWLVFI